MSCLFHFLSPFYCESDSFFLRFRSDKGERTSNSDFCTRLCRFRSDNGERTLNAAQQLLNARRALLVAVAACPLADAAGKGAADMVDVAAAQVEPEFFE